MRGSNSEKRWREVQTDFLNADLETGFALARSAEHAWREGDRQTAWRGIEEARSAMRDAARLRCTLKDAGAQRFDSRLRQLTVEIQRLDRLMRTGFFIDMVYN